MLPQSLSMATREFSPATCDHGFPIGLNGADDMRALCDDFAAECAALGAVLDTFEPSAWQETTQFAGWSIADVVSHLHFWNNAAVMAVEQPAALEERMRSVNADLAAGLTLREIEVGMSADTELDLFSRWQSGCEAVVACYAALSPTDRVQWAGPSMSVRSALSARLMETWAHGQEVFDHAGIERPENDRIAHVVRLGVNTYAWSFAVRGATPPGPMPYLVLRSPSGQQWVFGDDDGDNRISGDAVAFAQVVAQTRHVDDTALHVTGETATAWMACAQCFAGPPETPPAPGTRFRRC